MATKVLAHAPDRRGTAAFVMRAEDNIFLRLWHGFLTGRIMVALALVLLQGLTQALNQNVQTPEWTVCLFYLTATVTARLGGRRVPSPEAGPQWLPTLGVDLALVCALQWLHTGGMNFTPLLGLPILMAAVLGTLTLALGTTAAATLLLLSWAWWLGEHGGGDAAQRYLQAALTGTGYFIAAFLVHQLASRLVREQQLVQHSRMAARLQSQVSALVMQNLTDGVLVVDGQDAIRVANPAGLQLLDRNPGDLPLSMAQTPSWQPLLELARHTFSQNAPQAADVNLLVPGQRPMGLHVRTWLTAPHSTMEEVSADRLCVVFLHDLRETQARLRTEKMASMGRMSAAVAHEIRNPLAAIVQANALLDEDLQDPMHKRLSRMVQQNAERLIRISEEILDIARVQHQVNHSPPNALPLDATVAQVWRDWHQQDPVHRQASVTWGTGQLQVEFDAEHLRRVLVNLLDNALRYQGSAPDSLQLHTSISVNGQASVQVWSDGPPLDQSIERHLFEPFFSSESRSSGLGLYICRELSERHGASISYQRMAMPTLHGDAEGNAFTVHFRKAGRMHEASSLFDTLPPEKA